MTQTHRIIPPGSPAAPLRWAWNRRSKPDARSRARGLSDLGRVGRRERPPVVTAAAGYNSNVDPLAARAAEDYHRLLRDDKALVAELEERFFARIEQARLLFGGRALCAFPRPNFVAPSDYEAIRTVCRDIFRAV